MSVKNKVYYIIIPYSLHVTLILTLQLTCFTHQTSHQWALMHGRVLQSTLCIAGVNAILSRVNGAQGTRTGDVAQWQAR